MLKVQETEEHRNAICFRVVVVFKGIQAKKIDPLIRDVTVSTNVAASLLLNQHHEYMKI